MAEEHPDLFVTWPGWEILCVNIPSVEYDKLRPVFYASVVSYESMYRLPACVA